MLPGMAEATTAKTMISNASFAFVDNNNNNCQTPPLNVLRIVKITFLDRWSLPSRTVGCFG